MKGKQLETCYLMIVLKYIDSLETLKQFHMICKSCNEAIQATKINPNYGSNSLQTLLSYTELSNIMKEITHRRYYLVVKEKRKKLAMQLNTRFRSKLTLTSVPLRRVPACKRPIAIRPL